MSNNEIAAKPRYTRMKNLFLVFVAAGLFLVGAAVRPGHQQSTRMHLPEDFDSFHFGAIISDWVRRLDHYLG